MKLQSVFFCDDVRKEENGKLIFIGCYASDLLLSVVPTAEKPVGLRLFGVLCGEFSAENEIEVELLLDSEKLISGKLKSESIPGAFQFLALPFPPIQIKSLGKLSLRIKPDSGRWIDARSIQIAEMKSRMASPSISS